MPIYEYQAESKGCPQCADRFEAFQAISDKPLRKCPACGTAVRRVPSVPRPPQTPFLSNGNLQKKGLTKLVKNCDGKYEVSGPKRSDKGKSVERQLKDRGID